jgi:hypothetical protein
LAGPMNNCWSTRMFEPVHAVGQMLSPVCPWLWAKLGPVADGVVVGVALDAVRPRRDLVRENALLRHPIVVMRRKVPRPRLATRQVQAHGERGHVAGMAACGSHRPAGNGPAMASGWIPVGLAPQELGIRVGKRTVQKYMRAAPRVRGSTVVHIPAQSRRCDLVLRVRADVRRAVSTGVRVLHCASRLSPGGPHGHDV